MSLLTGSTSSWRVPPKEANEDRKLGWLKEAFEEGNSFNKNQRAFTNIDQAIDIISGLSENPVPTALSDINVNLIKRQAREIVATLSNLKPMWGYTTKNPAYDQQSFVLNHLVYNWWSSTFADRAIRKALQWSLCGIGYISPVWQPDFWPDGYGDVKLNVYGPRDVLLNQLPADHDIQGAYSVTIQVDEPLAECQRKWPQFADVLKPDRVPNAFSRRLRRATPQFLSPVLDRFIGGGKEDTSVSGPYVTVYYTYVFDQSTNTALKPVMMGQPGTSWNYQVPFPGQILESADGSTRKAIPQDCRLYPFRRLIISTGTNVLYDDTSYWWHGKVPLIPFTIDDWPWDYLGYSVVKDVDSLQRGIVSLLRGVNDAAELKVRPPVEYDENIVSKAFMDGFDPRIPGRRIPKRYGSAGVNFVATPDMPSWITQHIQTLREMFDHMLAIRDVSNLAKANQMPSDDTLDKLLEMTGPVVTDISRGMEVGLRELGEMFKSLVYQFYSVQRRVRVLGSGGMLPEDFMPLSRQEKIIAVMEKGGQLEEGWMNYNPQSLIPTDLTINQNSLVNLLPIGLNEVLRAKDTCIFHITPGSLHQITQMKERLLYLQMWRDGRFPVDPKTIADKVGLDNFGELPGNPITIMDRWMAWQDVLLKHQIQIQQEMAQSQQAIQANNLVGQVLGAAQQQASGAGGGAQQPTKPTAGRPPSGATAPKLATKDGGSRTIIKESK